VPAGRALLCARPRPPYSQGIGFAPEMIVPIAIVPRIFFKELQWMTVYLISLALMFLIGIAVLDGVS
jgi:hypothetical protein